MKIAGVVAAAGLSSRMGAFKPVLPYEGSSVIESTVNLLRKSGADHIFVIVGHHAEEIETLFTTAADVTCIRNKSYETSDMFASVRIGLQAAAEYDYVFFLPGDMPAVDENICRELFTFIQKDCALWGRPTKDGRGQHPVILSRAAAACAMEYQGDGGLRGALRSLPAPPLEMAVEDLGCTIDIDTPDEYCFLLRYTAEKKVRQKSAPVSCIHFV